MQKMNASFENLDLRSLRMLKHLLDLKSVTKAGEALGLSQPAASRVLAQLRITLGDPLLVRGRQGNTLTPRGEGLQPAVAEAMRSISALFEREVFAPSTAKLIVRIATTDHGATVVLSPLVKMLGTFAPGITAAGKWIVPLQPVTNGIQEYDLRITGRQCGVEASIFPSPVKQRVSLPNKTDGSLLIEGTGMEVLGQAAFRV